MIHTLTIARVAAEKLTGNRLLPTEGATHLSRPAHPHPDGCFRLSGQPTKLLLRGIALSGESTAQERHDLIRSLLTPYPPETPADSRVSRVAGEPLTPGAVLPDNTVRAERIEAG